MTWAKLLLSLSNLGNMVMGWFSRKEQRDAGEDAYARQVLETEYHNVRSAMDARNSASILPEDPNRRD